MGEAPVSHGAARRLTIARLGHKGDGETDDGIFVPLSAPGDQIVAEVDGERASIARIVTPGPDRVDATCPHFGACGGCALQHLSVGFLSDWKREQIATALGQRGLTGIEVAPTRVMPPQSRRRAELHARVTQMGIKIGFLERGSRVIVPMSACDVLTPAILGALDALGVQLEPLLPLHTHVAMHVLDSEHGLDVSLGIPDFALDIRSRQALSAMAAAVDLARLSVNGELIIMRREPVVTIAGVPVVPPPESFLQAVREAEVHMQDLACKALVSTKVVADLFAGIGTFAFALARTAKVHAVEGEQSALDALAAAARRTQGLKPISTERRDLFRRPLLAHELKAFDGVVLNPPRPGAKAQAEALAQSAVPALVYVSCSPASFARDARILVDGGFELKTVTPVDQFLWTPHIEAVGIFERRVKRR
ncbi:MAG TPA: RNA methyltransferase [Alphaproteobacteria bacterium]|nr:RNA methyltransferase [Alphaproteobacteria bacterium]HAJ45285.1 RNA methyltransferase [Alphaproteobacteria bacterium]